MENVKLFTASLMNVNYKKYQFRSFTLTTIKYYISNNLFSVIKRFIYNMYYVINFFIIKYHNIIIVSCHEPNKSNNTIMRCVI